MASLTGSEVFVVHVNRSLERHTEVSPPLPTQCIFYLRTAVPAILIGITLDPNAKLRITRPWNVQTLKPYLLQDVSRRHCKAQSRLKHVHHSDVPRVSRVLA